jgi:hypothetical protein
MKIKSLSLLLTIGLAAISNAAVTFNFATQTGSANGPNGLPIVDASGAAILNSTNSIFASIGYLTAGGDSTAQSVLSRFVALDSTPLTPSLVTGSTPRNGLINGADYTSATNVYPAGFQGKTAVVLIGNSSVLSSSTSIALFTFGAFEAPDGLGNKVQSFALTSASVPTLGTLKAVTTQPVAGNAFVNGVSLVPVAIPETSTSLLGALGALALLRRRRN